MLFNLSPIILVTISMVLSTLSLIIILFYMGVHLKTIKVVQSIALYVIITVGVYFSIIMFELTSNSVKADILDTIQNTQQYNGFIEPVYVLSIVLIGALCSTLWYYFMEYVKKVNFKNRNRNR
ncbi:hypothetical protein KQUDLBSD_CDS0059 [Staphylococcus phage PG-2021_40]|nr:membrane protein [Mammaliicoccus phage vB_MscM-PMS3]WBF82152.1 membrane protein [Mammaliicoccus virus vB_MscM-PMS2]